MIRNKHHHYDELPSSLKSRIGSSTDGLSRYIDRQFPRLLMHCYNFCVCNLGQDDTLSIDYKLPQSKLLSKVQPTKSDELSPLNEQKNGLSPIPDDTEQDDDQQKEVEDKEEVSLSTHSLENESDSPPASTTDDDDAVANGTTMTEIETDIDEDDYKEKRNRRGNW